jgi:drug/metabolite transporter (DMT)-like permease
MAISYPTAAPVALGLGSAVAWGLGDFTGGVLSRRANVFGVVAIAYAAGFSAMALCALGRGEAFIPFGDAMWGVAAGVIGGFALTAFYHGLAIGQMGVVAPISAVLTAVLPIIYAALTEGMPRELQIIGFVIALISIWMISGPHLEQGNRAGLLMAVASGICFGGYLILIRKAGAHGVFWPLAIARGSSSVAVFLLSGMTRNFRAPGKTNLPMVVLAGLLDASGIAFFLIAARMGRMDIPAVLSAMYPAVTVVLARYKLHEHLQRSQQVGIAVALVAVAMIAV